MTMAIKETKRKRGQPKKQNPTRSRTVSIPDDKAKKIEKKYGSLTEGLKALAETLPDLK